MCYALFIVAVNSPQPRSGNLLQTNLVSLFSLHDYSYGLDIDSSCYAKFLRITCDEKPSLKVVEGRHPIVIATNTDKAFIPNSFELDDRLAILTGANMGKLCNQWRGQIYVI